MLKYKISVDLAAGQATMTWLPDHEIKWSGSRISSREDETDEDGLVITDRRATRAPGTIWGGYLSVPLGGVNGGSFTWGFYPGKSEGFGSSAWVTKKLEGLAQELVVLLTKVEAAAPSPEEWKTL